MGNNHAVLHSKTKKHRFADLRCLSVPSSSQNTLHTARHPNHVSLGCDATCKQQHESIDSSATAPRIQLNGEDSVDEHSPRITYVKRKARTGCADAAERRMKFLSSAGSLTMRSLDDGAISDVEVTLKPLKDRARSLSPLKQLRTYSFRSVPSEENFLSDAQCNSIRQSWSAVTRKLDSGSDRNFGFFVFARVLSRAANIRRVFMVDGYDSLEQVPSSHSIHRHTRLFTNVIDLAVRNVVELENEMAPTMFTYGQRHYLPSLQGHFDEKSVRLFCSQVVCTVADALDGDVQPLCMDAWIEMMRFLGGKLLDGFQFAHLASTKKLAINTNDHVFFVL